MNHAKSMEFKDFSDQVAAVLAAVRQAVRQTLLDHKRSGDPVVFCEGDQVRWVPAAEIEIPDVETPTSD